MEIDSVQDVAAATGTTKASDDGARVSGHAPTQSPQHHSPDCSRDAQTGAVAGLASDDLGRQIEMPSIGTSSAGALHVRAVPNVITAPMPTSQGRRPSPSFLAPPLPVSYAPRRPGFLCCIPACWARVEPDAAAVLLQNAARRRRAMHERHARVRERAARRLQQGWDLYNLRLDAQDEAEELRRRKRVYAIFMKVEEKAAIAMQRAFRLRAVDRIIEHAAAVPLQKGARALLAKRALAAKRAEASAAADARRRHDWEIKVARLFCRGERRAAMRIQLAFWRWHILRAEQAEAAALAEVEAEAAHAAHSTPPKKEPAPPATDLSQSSASASLSSSLSDVDPPEGEAHANVADESGVAASLEVAAAKETAEAAAAAQAAAKKVAAAKETAEAAAAAQAAAKEVAAAKETAEAAAAAQAAAMEVAAAKETAAAAQAAAMEAAAVKEAAAEMEAAAVPLQKGARALLAKRALAAKRAEIGASSGLPLDPAVLKQRQLEEVERERRQAQYEEETIKRAEYRKRTLRSLPVRKRAKRWPRHWEAREMGIDETRGRLEWRVPDGGSYTVNDRKHAVSLSEIHEVRVVDRELHVFEIVAATRVYEFRAPCLEALEAWIETIEEHMSGGSAAASANSDEAQVMWLSGAARRDPGLEGGRVAAQVAPGGETAGVESPLLHRAPGDELSKQVSFAAADEPPTLASERLPAPKLDSPVAR